MLRHDFAVVLLDVLMPGMDGFETATHIKRLDQTRDVPIIFLTGTEPGAGSAFRGYAVGAVDYLTKPFDPWVLRSKVTVFMELFRKTSVLREQAALLAQLVRDHEALAGFAQPARGGGVAARGAVGGGGGGRGAAGGDQGSGGPGGGHAGRVRGGVVRTGAGMSRADEPAG